MTPNPNPSPELLPCPICGEQPKRNGKFRAGGVKCAGPGQGIGKLHLIQTYGADQAEADAAWNTRAAHTLTDGVSGCADCGLRYDDPSWVDMVLSHEEWIKLDTTVTAILCMTCMAKRAAKAGFVPVVEGLYGALSSHSRIDSHVAQTSIAGVLLGELTLDPDRRWEIAGLILAALSPQALPAPGEAMVLVPRVPTEAMLKAGQAAADDHRWKWCGYGPRKAGEGLDGMMFHVREAFTAMLAASPEPVPAPQESRSTLANPSTFGKPTFGLVDDRTLPAPGEVATAVELLEQYAEFIRSDVKAADLERHPYLPLIDQTIKSLATVAAANDEGVWQPIETAPTDGTLILALYRDNGLFVYALAHYRCNRDGTEGWYDGTIPAAKPPLAWQSLPDIAAAIRLLSQGGGK